MQFNAHERKCQVIFFGCAATEGGYRTTDRVFSLAKRRGFSYIANALHVVWRSRLEANRL